MNVFGREAINLGIDDLRAFESRLRATPVEAMGYPTSLKTAVQNAVRYLHVAAREGTAEDLRAVLHIKRRRRTLDADAEPLPVTPAGRVASRARQGAHARPTPGHGGSKEQNVKDASPLSARGADGSAGRTLAEVDGVIDRLAALQTKIGAWTAETEREVVSMLVATFSDRAVLQLLAAVPAGYRQPVQDASPLPDRPDVSTIARRVLVEMLVARRVPQTQS